MSEYAKADRRAHVEALAAQLERYLEGERTSPRRIRAVLRRLEGHVAAMSRYVFDALEHAHGRPQALRLHDALAAAPADSELSRAAWDAAAACQADQVARRAVALASRTASDAPHGARFAITVETRPRAGRVRRSWLLRR